MKKTLIMIVMIGLVVMPTGNTQGAVTKSRGYKVSVTLPVVAGPSQRPTASTKESKSEDAHQGIKSEQIIRNNETIILKTMVAR